MSDDLRAALTDVTLAHRHLLGDSDVSREDASALLLEVERALRAAIATSDGLDVERLAAALGVDWSPAWHERPTAQAHVFEAHWDKQELARIIAREYAALRSTPEAE